MISITPKTDESQIDELKDSLKILTKKQESRNLKYSVFLILLWIPISIVLFKIIGAELCSAWFALSIAYLVAGGFLYAYIQSKTRLRFDINRIKSEIDRQTELARIENERIATEKEEIAIKLLTKIELECNIRNDQMLSIESEIKYKRKWREEFDDFPSILQRNRQLDSIAIESFRQARNDVRRSHPDFRKWDSKYLYSGLGYNNYAWLKWRLESMKGWEPPDYNSRNRASADRYEDTDEINDKKRFSEVPHIEPEIKEENNLSGIDEARPQSRVKNITPTEIDPSEKPQGSLFDEFSLSEKPIAEVPRQKERLPKHRIIKISDKLRQQIDAKKVEIGKLGEMAVVEFEKRRLRNTQPNAAIDVRHVSLTDDGAGYDVQSWDGENEIYIEVKTTVGDFWSNLFFTQNEFEKMLESAEQYHLYRLCNFNLETGEGQLFIYFGKDLIVDCFEFNSKMYLLSEKSH